MAENAQTEIFKWDIFRWFSYSVKNPKEFASTIRKVGHDFPIFLFLHFKASAAAGTHRARDYGNWSFSLLTWALDLWADERHKALITFVIRNADAFKARENKGEFKIAIYTKFAHIILLWLRSMPWFMTLDVARYVVISNAKIEMQQQCDSIFYASFWPWKMSLWHTQKTCHDVLLYCIQNKLWIEK